jgi:hypothetical protein
MLRLQAHLHGAYLGFENEHVLVARENEISKERIEHLRGSSRLAVVDMIGGGPQSRDKASVRTTTGLPNREMQ